MSSVGTCFIALSRSLAGSWGIHSIPWPAGRSASPDPRAGPGARVSFDSVDPGLGATYRLGQLADQTRNDLLVARLHGDSDQRLRPGRSQYDAAASRQLR